MRTRALTGPQKLIQSEGKDGDGRRGAEGRPEKTHKPLQGDRETQRLRPQEPTRGHLEDLLRAGATTEKLRSWDKKDWRPRGPG